MPPLVPVSLLFCLRLRCLTVEIKREAIDTRSFSYGL